MKMIANILEDVKTLTTISDSLLKFVQLISFDTTFNEPIDRLAICEHLEEVYFGNYLIEETTGYILNEDDRERLEHEFDHQVCTFNQPIDALANCKKLRIVSFHIHFNQSIEPLKECKELTTLALGYYFNQPITVLEHLPNLSWLNLAEYNGSIETLSRCANLGCLIFGNTFNQEIFALSHLLSLCNVTFGYSFKCSLLPLCSSIIGDSQFEITISRNYIHPSMNNFIKLQNNCVISYNESDNNINNNQKDCIIDYEECTPEQYAQLLFGEAYVAPKNDVDSFFATTENLTQI
jgi:hypothetical protein